MLPINDSTFWSTWMQSPQVLDLSRRRRFTPELKELFFSSLGLTAHSKMLDVGCGPGTFARFLARYIEPPGLVFGLDKDGNFIAHARKQAESEHVSDRVRYYVDDALILPFENDAFDAVVSYTVIEHIPDTARFISEQIRVCKPGGTVAAMGVMNSGKGSSTDGPIARGERYDALLAKLGK
ncbi:MAG: methyltransferase domain-containing protein, partial [Candidatus Edwardsbacteria bacterium]|nr:methyltransferase domain-containing protein [Candidatus Edwardsbacteria bacterium]